MRIIRTMKKDGLRLLADRRATIGVAFAMLLPVLALGVGFGLNVVQLLTIKSNLHHALDSAVTSTARDLTTGVIPEEDARDNVEAFLYANGGQTFARIDEIKLDTVDVNHMSQIVSAVASVDVDVLFPLFGMNNHQHIAVETAAQYSDKNIEVAMMLDVTGSMAKDWRSDKIGDLRDAAAEAVDRLLEKNRDPHDPRIRVALVPYAHAVNAGSLAATSVFVEREAKERGEAPGNEDPKLASAGAPRRPDTCATERKGTYQYSDAGPRASMVNRDYFLDAFAEAKDYRTCPEAAVVPLTADGAKLHATIGDLVADGRTGGQIGIQWTWYMLSHRWASVLTASEKPAPRNPDEVAKVAILMTDGLFNTAFAGLDDLEQIKREQPAKSRDYAERLCTAMKRDGIQIYTIGFMLSSGAEAVLRDCASDDIGPVRHFYKAANGEELKTAYKKIIENVENLAVIK